MTTRKGVNWGAKAGRGNHSKPKRPLGQRIKSHLRETFAPTLQSYTGKSLGTRMGEKKK